MHCRKNFDCMRMTPLHLFRCPTRPGSLALALLLALLAGGCTGLKQYRTDYNVHDATSNPTNAQRAALEVTTNYVLGLVEFDDQGWMWDPKQMDAVLQRFSEEDHTNGLLMVVFVHGWKHNASVEDDNVIMFRTVLAELAAMERQLSEGRTKPRRVAGVYVGWRGLSNKAWLLRQLTFWDRKNSAQEVGRGGVTELYSRLEDLRNGSRVQHRRDADFRPSQLIIVGHSFGGALTFSALAPLVVERAVQSDPGTQTAGAVRGFGDLIVLVNPAFEAARFRPLYRIATERKWYLPDQSINLAIFTSKTDDATKVAFPAGRWFSTLWEKNRDTDQGRANRAAVGHYAPFITHDLVPFTNQTVAATNQTAAKPPRSPTVRSAKYKGHETITNSVEQVKSLKRQMQRSQEKSAVEMPDRSYQFSGAKLIPRTNHIAHMPVINVSVDHSIIPNHGDIDTQAFLTFLREFVGAFTADEVAPRR